MTNTIKTLSDGDITNEALFILKNYNGVIKKVDRQYDEDFGREGHKNAGNLLIRLPNRYTVGTGQTITPQDTTELSTTLTVGTQYHVPTQFYSYELTLSMDEFSRRVLKPAMGILASKVANVVALAAAQGFVNYVGTPGTTPSSFLTYANAGAMLDWQAAPPNDRAAVLSPTSMAALADAQKGLFGPRGEIDGAFEGGAIEQMTGFDFVKDQSIASIAHGAGASYTTHGTTPLASNGASALAIITGTGALTAGQQFTIAGVNEVNQDLKTSTGNLKVFTVATDYAGGAGNVTVSQPIYTSGPYQNVSTTIPTTTALTLIGTASTTYPRNLAFHRQSIALATADLEIPKGVDMAYRAVQDGLSLRFVRFYDGTNDKFIGRFDIFLGTKVVRPEHGVVVYG